MIYHTAIVGNPKNLVICLPGRGQNPMHLLDIYSRECHLKDVAFLAVAPKSEWYPPPRGTNNSRDAIKGLPFAVEAVDNFINSLDIPSERIVLMGFSAGAVVAIKTSLSSDKEFAGVISHSGAILDTTSVPQCEKTTPYLITHSQDDSVFKLEDRLIPMFKALVHNNHPIKMVINPEGGHTITPSDFEVAKEFLSTVFS